MPPLALIDASLTSFNLLRSSSKYVGLSPPTPLPVPPPGIVFGAAAARWETNSAAIAGRLAVPSGLTYCDLIAAIFLSEFSPNP